MTEQQQLIMNLKENNNYFFAAEGYGRKQKHCLIDIWNHSNFNIN